MPGRNTCNEKSASGQAPENPFRNLWVHVARLIARVGQILLEEEILFPYSGELEKRLLGMG